MRREPEAAVSHVGVEERAGDTLAELVDLGRIHRRIRIPGLRLRLSFFRSLLFIYEVK